MQRLLPQYEFYGLCGRGGMGVVYHARQISLDRPVAIKVLPGALMDDVEKNYVERFRNEARTLARMRHPSIVNVYDFGKTADELLYIVMEYVKGTDVGEMIRSQGKLPAEQAIDIAMRVCEALEYAHRQGVIHRDIKPSNVLVDEAGRVKVADFGLAKATSGAVGMTSTNMTVGTPGYVSPEALIIGLRADHRADLYAVGVMLYHMLTGDIPRGRFKMASRRADTDPRLDDVINFAMEPEREERYQNASEIHSDLSHIRSVPASDSVKPVSTSRLPKFRLWRKARDARLQPLDFPHPGLLPFAPSTRRIPVLPPVKSPPIFTYFLLSQALLAGLFYLYKISISHPQNSESGTSSAGFSHRKVLDPSLTSPGLISAGSTPSPTATFPTPGWTPVLWEKGPPPQGKLRDGAVIVAADKVITLPLPVAKDAALRFKAKRNDDFLRGVTASLRVQGNGARLVMGTVYSWGDPHCLVGSISEKDPKGKNHTDVPCKSLAAGKESVFEFAAIGDCLMLSIDGRLITSLINGDVMEPGITNLAAGRGETEFRDIEFFNLVGVAPAAYPPFVKQGLTALGRTVR